MIIHHIKPEQFAQLEVMFGKETSKGLEVPAWPSRLRETANAPPVVEDFPATAPQPDIQPQ